MSGLLKVANVAKRLNVADSSAYKLIQTGKLRAVVFDIEKNGVKKRRPCVRVREEDLDAFIKKHLQPLDG